MYGVNKADISSIRVFAREDNTKIDKKQPHVSWYLKMHMFTGLPFRLGIYFYRVPETSDLYHFGIDAASTYWR